jgi:hypothetical protein
MIARVHVSWTSQYPERAGARIALSCLDNRYDIYDNSDMKHTIQTAVPLSMKVGQLTDAHTLSRYVDSIHSGVLDDEDEENGDVPLPLDPTKSYQLQLMDPKKLKVSTFVDSNKVDDYANTVSDFPPIVTDGTGNVLDGGHRVEAAIRRGDTQITGFAPLETKPATAVTPE